MEQSQIQKLLPEVVQRTCHEDSVLEVLLSIMSELHRPSESLLDQLQLRFNPEFAPEELLPMLAHWMDLLRLFQPESNDVRTNHWQQRTLPTDAQNLRNLIASATSISKWRGTRYGMLQMLEIATGMKGYEIEEGAIDVNGEKVPEPFHIHVTVPPGADIHKDLIGRIVMQEKPVYTTVSVSFQ